jgi:hypothetical protein
MAPIKKTAETPYEIRLDHKHYKGVGEVADNTRR